MTCHAARRIPSSGSRLGAEAGMNRCPFLSDLTADWLVLYPLSVFCRRPDRRIRIPAPATLATHCCWGNGFRDCQRYGS
jgi:hypothetical protein